MMGQIERLLELKPYEKPLPEKNLLFLSAMHESLVHHATNNPLYLNFLKSHNYDYNRKPSCIEEIPYLPVNLFKNKQLLSVPKESIKKTLQSSATSGIPSKVNIDLLTSKRQTLVSTKVMTHFLGNHRRPFIILDVDPSKARSTEISARYAATLGFMMLASKSYFALSEPEPGKLQLELDLFQEYTDQLQKEEQDVCVFGFTFILYDHVIRPLKEKGIQLTLPENSKIAHIGGWKKLESKKVGKKQFLEDIESTLGISPENVIDVYGFTEQMGLIYPNRGMESKLTPCYAEIIIRDYQTLKPIRDGEEGHVQILTPVPHSYPGISILTEDVGVIRGREQLPDGSNGIQFEILGRAKDAEVRGCGDIMSEYVTAQS